MRFISFFLIKILSFEKFLLLIKVFLFNLIFDFNFLIRVYIYI